MVTSIQLSFEAKNALDKIKSKKETYEDVILNLMQLAEKSKREDNALLIEGCREMAKTNLEISKEFESIEDLGLWEW